MRKIEVLFETLDARYLALCKTGITLSRTDYEVIKGEIKRLSSENDRLIKRLAFLETNQPTSDNGRIGWYE